MQVVYALKPFPDSWAKAIFLAGPTPRDKTVPSWRPTALKILKDLGYDGVVFVPEPQDGKWATEYTDQTEWEKKGLNYADAILFWIPRDLETMPAFTSNVEFGRWVSSGKVVLGHPMEAPKTRYLDWMLKDETGGHEKVHYSLAATLIASLVKIGEGTDRIGGERGVPLQIWNTPSFQAWYKNLKEVGNRLEEAEQRWVFRMPKLQVVFSWVLWVKVWIQAEQRYKENEWVFARADISTIVLWNRPPHTKLDETDELDTELILIREFRSPARTPDGFIHELAGGSSAKPEEDPRTVAREEVEEETGLSLPTERFMFLGSRQVSGTLSPHHAHLFMAQLTPEEMSEAKRMAAAGTTHGMEEDSELTYIEVKTFREVLNEELVDWSMLGMIAKALLN